MHHGQRYLVVAAGRPNSRDHFAGDLLALTRKGGLVMASDIPAGAYASGELSGYSSCLFEVRNRRAARFVDQPLRLWEPGAESFRSDSGACQAVSIKSR
jgi:hypothetical protein